MKLNDVYAKPLNEIIKELELTSMHVDTDEENGELKALRLTYKPKFQADDLKKSTRSPFELKGGWEKP